jgi:hypothetical protein
VAVLSILLIVAGSILAAIALAVRFAGSNAILSGVRPGDVPDMAALNRWAGNRLLAPPAISLVFGVAGLRDPVYGLVGVGALAIVGFATIMWLMLGTERFRTAR